MIATRAKTTAAETTVLKTTATTTYSFSETDSQFLKLIFKYIETCNHEKGKIKSNQSKQITLVIWPESCRPLYEKCTDKRTSQKSLSKSSKNYEKNKEIICRTNKLLYVNKFIVPSYSHICMVFTKDKFVISRELKYFLEKVLNLLIVQHDEAIIISGISKDLPNPFEFF